MPWGLSTEEEGALRDGAFTSELENEPVTYSAMRKWAQSEGDDVADLVIDLYTECLLALRDRQESVVIDLVDRAPGGWLGGGDAEEWLRPGVHPSDGAGLGDDVFTVLEDAVLPFLQDQFAPIWNERFLPAVLLALHGVAWDEADSTGGDGDGTGEPEAPSEGFLLSEDQLEPWGLTVEEADLVRAAAVTSDWANDEASCSIFRKWADARNLGWVTETLDAIVGSDRAQSTGLLAPLRGVKPIPDVLGPMAIALVEHAGGATDDQKLDAKDFDTLRAGEPGKEEQRRGIWGIFWMQATTAGLRERGLPDPPLTAAAPQRTEGPGEDGDALPWGLTQVEVVAIRDGHLAAVPGNDQLSRSVLEKWARATSNDWGLELLEVSRAWPVQTRSALRALVAKTRVGWFGEHDRELREEAEEDGEERLSGGVLWMLSSAHYAIDERLVSMWNNEFHQDCERAGLVPPEPVGVDVIAVDDAPAPEEQAAPLSPIDDAVDWKAVATENERALKETAAGESLPFWQLGERVLLGPGHDADAYDAFTARQAATGTVTVVSRGRLTDPGRIRVTGSPDTAAFKRVIGRFSNKKVDFA